MWLVRVKDKTIRFVKFLGNAYNKFFFCYSRIPCIVLGCIDIFFWYNLIPCIILGCIDIRLSLLYQCWWFTDLVGIGPISLYYALKWRFIKIITHEKEHEYGNWNMINCGMEQIRFCKKCGKMDKR